MTATLSGRAAVAMLLGLLIAAELPAETVTYYATDHLGSPVAAMDADGNVLWRESYTPYGEKLENPSGAGNDTGYTGHQSDAVTGLTYMQARYYDPIIGRFMATDPVQFDGSNSSHFGRFLYANNSPMVFTDPIGFDSLVFNGTTLQAVNDPGDATRSWSAVSGRPGAGPADSYRKNIGPIPEGNFSIDPAKSNKWSVAKAILGWGSKRAWGDTWTIIEPKDGTFTNGRDEMYVHGGAIPESAGCIDLTSDNNSFHEWLSKQDGPVELSVDYPDYVPPAPELVNPDGTIREPEPEPQPQPTE